METKNANAALDLIGWVGAASAVWDCLSFTTPHCYSGVNKIVFSQLYYAYDLSSDVYDKQLSLDLIKANIHAV